ncbi:NepR family anti-sigma factor [Altererythrobacter arenosus]|uniref:NepR family anti-sigma factor n=2 Tax=Altererythrobacter arenosus TaxID=3032592 RepID=A0ABY8FRT1_9SPHN|nr:NepR family anti-sigma factor [Altererythrobacter sp. CAU 1644]WFL76111.1 NepR family anti-sigma factor [Altererythrobacter sp. CAU 1644]
MTSEKPKAGNTPNKQANNATRSQDKTPGWADGLRKLYDSVVDEPIPDSFKDLLSKLDESGSSGSSQGDGA